MFVLPAENCHTSNVTKSEITAWHSVRSINVFVRKTTAACGGNLLNYIPQKKQKGCVCSNDVLYNVIHKFYTKRYRDDLND
jgi:hypothetical protein